MPPIAEQLEGKNGNGLNKNDKTEIEHKQGKHQ